MDWQLNKLDVPFSGENANNQKKRIRLVLEITTNDKELLEESAISIDELTRGGAKRIIAAALQLGVAEYIDMSGKLLTFINKPLVTCETVSQQFKLGIDTTPYSRFRLYLDRPDFIKLIAKDADISLHQAENVLNAIFGHLKKMLSQESIDSVAADIEAPDLRTVWATAELAEHEEDEIAEIQNQTKEAKRWH